MYLAYQMTVIKILWVLKIIFRKFSCLKKVKDVSMKRIPPVYITEPDA